MVMEFRQLLQRLASAVEDFDREAFVDCFTPDGIYADYLLGRKQGQQGLREMLAHFYVGGENFRWEFFEPVCAGDRGYARSRFSFDSLHADALGKRIAFDAMSCLDLRGGRISYYRDVFDRGMALAQQNYAPERIVRIEQKHGEEFRREPEWALHFTPGGRGSVR